MDAAPIPFRLVFQLGCFLALFVWAWRKGDGPERACAVTLFGMLASDQMYHLLITPAIQVETVDIWHLTVDLVVLASLVPVSLKANRLYPMILAALQVIAVNGHFARDAFEQITPLAYLIMIVTPSYGQLLVLAFGIWSHVRREERFGPYRAWRTSPVQA